MSSSVTPPTQAEPALTTYPALPRDVLGVLLDLHGSPDPDGISPRLLLGAAPALTPQQRDELVQYGLLRQKRTKLALTPAFAQIADVLVHPQTNVTFRLWSANDFMESNVQFPGQIAQGGGVILNQVDHTYHLAAFLGPDTILRVLRDGFLDAVRDVKEQPFSAHFDAPLAAAFFGVIDLARQETFAELAGKTKRRVAWSAQEITEFVLTNWGTTSLIQYLSPIMAVGAYGAPPSPEALEAGLVELLRSGMFDLRGGKYYPHGALQRILSLGMMIQAGLQWQRVSLIGSGKRAISSRVVLFTGESLLICFDRSIERKIFVQTIGYDSLVDYFASELASQQPLFDASSPTAQHESSGVPQETLIVCNSCQQVSKPGEFCTRCGRPLGGKAKESICGQCGAKTASAMKFCTRCGHPLRTGHARSANVARAPHPAAAPSEKPALQFCEKCGASLGPATFFCTRCGTRRGS